LAGALKGMPLFLEHSPGLTPALRPLGMPSAIRTHLFAPAEMTAGLLRR
jgi:hypothetical protein